MLAIEPAETGEIPDEVGQQLVGSEVSRCSKVLPLKEIATSERSSSSEIEDEGCKFGMEDDEEIPEISPVPALTGAETKGAAA